MTESILPVEVALGARALLGEGPLWDEEAGLLRWVDVLGCELHAFDPVEGRDESLPLPQPVTSVALTEQGWLLLALADRLAVLEKGAEEVRQLGAFTVDRAKVRFNDGKVDPWGGYQIGTMEHGGTDPLGSLYRLSPDLSVTELFDSVICSNGLDWSEDRRSFFHIDSLLGRVDVYSTDPATGEMTGRREPLAVPPPGIPDGFSLDVEGCLWVAMWGGGEVRRLTPRGEVDKIIRLPVSQVTSLTFGGPARDELYITTARDGLSDGQLAEQPHAGDLFWCRPGTSGAAPNRFGGQP